MRTRHCKILNFEGMIGKRLNISEVSEVFPKKEKGMTLGKQSR
jgi:hypothetical protein